MEAVLSQKFDLVMKKENILLTREHQNRTPRTGTTERDLILCLKNEDVGIPPQEKYCHFNLSFSVYIQVFRNV